MTKGNTAASLGFFAYPESSPIIVQAISGAVELSEHRALKLKPWQKVRIIGFKLDDLIRQQIHDADVLAADITYPNHNVFYEIGYAIAAGKPVVPSVNVAIEKSIDGIQKIGPFDTIGWVTYVNSDELSAKLNDWNDISWRNRYTRRRDYAQPLFILDNPQKNGFPKSYLPCGRELSCSLQEVRSRGDSSPYSSPGYSRGFVVRWNNYPFY